MTTNSLETFIDYGDVSPAVGTRLEIMDREDFDVYDCTVTRIENGQIYVLRDDKIVEELADVVCLQPPSNGEENDEY